MNERRPVNPDRLRRFYRDGITEPLRGWEGAFWFAGVYVVRVWTLGLIPALIVSFLVGSGGSGLGAGIVVIAVNGLVGMGLWPGSVLLTRGIIRLWPARTWNCEPWRAWLSAALTTALIWLTPLILKDSFPEPPVILRTLVGSGGAWFLWICTLIIGTSSLSQAFVWSLTSTPRTARLPVS
jgi:hypothetical protein